MTIEMPSDEFVNFCLASCVEILEFMDSLEFDYVEAVGEHAVWLALE